jgi:hypothetical protein
LTENPNRISQVFQEQGLRVSGKAFPGVLAVVLLFTGCKKEAPNREATTAAKPVAPPPVATPAAASPGADANTETTAKLAGAAWALKQDEIKNDQKGQWAIQATASSTYNDAQGTAGWSANQATGAPNVEKYTDDGRAWAPKTPDGGIEWLDLKYPRPVYGEEVRVRESCGSGAVIKIEVFDEQGTAHTVWAGNDPTTDLNYLIAKFPKTSFKTDRVKVTLATNVVPGWNEIDAVQLVGSDQ